MTKLTEERIKELATAQRGPRGELIWPDFPINFARAIEAVLQPVQEPIAYAVFTQEGNIRLWSRNFEDLLKAEKMIATPLYAAPPDQTAEIERLNEGWKQASISALEKGLRCDTLEAVLRAAKEMVESWGAYASPYFQERHDLVGDIAILSKALGEE